MWWGSAFGEIFLLFSFVEYYANSTLVYDVAYGKGS